jgi:predicted amidohydrolase/dienelactone hydrolase
VLTVFSASAEGGDTPSRRVEQQPGDRAYQDPGVKDNLPVFRDQLAQRLSYPLSWLSGKYETFEDWRRSGRAKVKECLLTTPPNVPFDPVVLAEQDRVSYVVRKIVFNISGDSRVLGLLVVPKGKGPFPAALLLHDHGAKFDIGKEKVIRTWNDRPEKQTSAQDWVEKYYGGRYLGDELAKRGYVCFCTDALNWSHRGGAGYEGQQALAGNLLHFGMSFAGLIAHEDLRAAEFLATRPEVDGKRVAAMGLSMGSFRTWQVAALSDHIAAGVAVCWMATVKGLMVAGNNATRGQSAFTMTHPGLFSFLDYPDVASLACPKPMLFYNGLKDTLFPVPSVRDAYEKMHKIWASQHAENRLETRLWDVPHVFNLEMQQAAFAWLDRALKNENREPGEQEQKEKTEGRLKPDAAGGQGAARAVEPGTGSGRTVRVAGVVLKWVRADKEANYNRAEPLIREAAAHGAKIVCTTECFLDGYAIADKGIPLERYRALGEPIPGGPYYRRLAALAGELRIYLVAGMLEADGEARYNTAVLIGPDGKLMGRYHKQKLGHEIARNTAGSASLAFETPYGRLGLMICADRTDPAIVHRLRTNGADLLLCPSGGMFGPKDNDPIVQARSRENHLPIVFVHPAEFLVTGPDGSILEQTLLGDALVIAQKQAKGGKDLNQVFYIDLPMRPSATSARGRSHK